MLYRRFVFHFYLFVMFSSALWAGPGFFAETFIPRQAPVFSQFEEAIPASDNASVSVNLDLHDTSYKVLPTLFGNNLNGWMKSSVLNDSAAHAHIRNANMTYLRLPGGNWSNVWMWDHTIPSPVKDNYDQDLRSAPAVTWSRSTEELYQLAVDVNAVPQPCVNYSLARYYDTPDRVERAASYAADWVRDWNVDKGRNVPYWEVGNENFGSWQAGFEVTGLPEISGGEYGRDFRVFRDSMRAADPDIKVGAVIVGEDNGSASGGHKWWMRDLLPEVIDEADFLILHEYFTWAPDMNAITVDEVLAAVQKIREDQDSVAAMVERYTDKSGDHLPIAMTEYNMRAGSKNTAFVSVMFISMALAEFAQSGYGLVNLWDVTNGYAEGDDHGTLSKNHPQLDDYTPQGNFFAYYFMNQFLGEQMLNIQNVDLQGLYVAASRFAGDEVGLIVANPTSQNKTLSFNIDHFSPGDRMYWYTVYGDDGLDRTFDINSTASDQPEFGPSNYQNILPRSAVLGGSQEFTAEPWSVNYILLESEVSTSAQQDQSLNSVLAKSVSGILFRNGVLELSRAQFRSFRVFDLQSRELSFQVLHHDNKDIVRLQINHSGPFVVYSPGMGIPQVLVAD